MYTIIVSSRLESSHELQLSRHPDPRPGGRLSPGQPRNDLSLHSRWSAECIAESGAATASESKVSSCSWRPHRPGQTSSFVPTPIANWKRSSSKTSSTKKPAPSFASGKPSKRRKAPVDRVDPSTLLFFDASCLIAAASSPAGGAGFLWGLCARGFLQAAVSQAVLSETASNLASKFDASCLERHQRQLRTCAPRIAPIPLLDRQPHVYPQINSKDEHVVAAALAVRADVILTLDRPLVREIERAALGIPAKSPGDFIQIDLTTHPFLAVLREE